jgi:predicted RNA polymerase sigma factor
MKVDSFFVFVIKVIIVTCSFMLQKVGRETEAQAAFQQALKLSPNDPSLSIKR